MYRLMIIASFVLSICLLSACSLNHKESTLEEMSYRAAGSERNTSLLRTNTVESKDPAIQIEQRVESLPGIYDASVFFYGVDTLIVGVDTDEVAAGKVIESRIRQELLGEAKHYLIYIVTEDHADLLERVKATSIQIQQRTASEQEVLGVVNGVWKSILPFNYLSKS